MSLIRRYSVYLAFCDGWAQVPDGWVQIIDDWAQARSGPPLATPLSTCPYIYLYLIAHYWDSYEALATIHELKKLHL